MNLISVEYLVDMNYFVGLDDSSCCVQDRRTRVVIGTGHRPRGSSGLYVLNRLSLPLSSISVTTPAPIPLSSFVGPATPCPSASTSEKSYFLCSFSSLSCTSYHSPSNAQSHDNGSIMYQA